jgi:LacI family transcriptional regulator
MRGFAEDSGWQFYRVMSATDTWMKQIADGAIDAASERGGPEVVDVELNSRLLEIGFEGCLGVIAPAWHDRYRELVRQGIPVVNVSNAAGRMSGFANVLSDDAKVGRLAARYLLGRGYRHFVVVSDSVGAAHLERADAFEAELLRAGLTARRYHHDFVRMGRAMSMRAGWSRSRFQAEIGEVVRPWFEGMPMDTAIFVTNDWLAWSVLKAIDVGFPEHRNTVGVLGVDNEQPGWYPGALPSLSSVRPAFSEIGRRAMRWLFEHPGAVGLECMGEFFERVPPLGIVTRASTACGGCRDPLTARMMRWAWERVQREEPVSVSQMARSHGINIKALERRFAEHAGTTAVGFIGRLKLDLARHLLKETNLPVTEIAARCGYAKHDVLSRAFLLAEGCSPRDYRMLHRRNVKAD